jgi:hypothetical protein
VRTKKSDDMVIEGGERGKMSEIERIGETSRHLTSFRYIAKISLARCWAHFRRDGRDMLGPLGQCRGPTAYGDRCEGTVGRGGEECIHAQHERGSASAPAAAAPAPPT